MKLPDEIKDNLQKHPGHAIRALTNTEQPMPELKRFEMLMQRVRDDIAMHVECQPEDVHLIGIKAVFMTVDRSQNIMAVFTRKTVEPGKEHLLQDL